MEVRRVGIDARRPRPAAPAPAPAAFNEEAEGHGQAAPLAFGIGACVDGVDVRFPALRELPLLRWQSSQRSRWAQLSEVHLAEAACQAATSASLRPPRSEQRPVRAGSSSIGALVRWSTAPGSLRRPRATDAVAAPGPPTCALTRNLSARRAAANAPIEGSPPEAK